MIAYEFIFSVSKFKKCCQVWCVSADGVVSLLHQWKSYNAASHTLYNILY